MLYDAIYYDNVTLRKATRRIVDQGCKGRHAGTEDNLFGKNSMVSPDRPQSRPFHQTIPFFFKNGVWRNEPSYAAEHLRMRPVMDQVRKSKDCKPISAGFEIQGEVQARVTWVWHSEKEQIIGVSVDVDESQIELAKEKIEVLFAQAGLPKPDCVRA